MWDRICAYLTFTRKERLGVLVLLGVILLLFVLPYFIRPETGSPDPAAYDKYQDGIRKFQSRDRAQSREKTDLNDLSDTYSDQKKPAAGSLDYRDLQDARADPYYASREKFHPANESLPGKTEYESELFYFDPNSLPADGWRRLGLPDKLILTISHYLQKGGSFRTATDLKKLYGLKAQDFDRLFPYVRIRSSAKSDFPRQYPHREWNAEYSGKRNAVNYAKNYAGSGLNGGRNNKPPPEYSGSKNYDDLYSRRGSVNGNNDSADDRRYATHASWRFSNKHLENLDINLADSAVWSRLPGISFRLACRIVHFRNRLGGFHSVDQVGETFGLPDSTFQLIRPFLHCGEMGVQKINLNIAGLEGLQAHPYIRWKLAKEIIQYRAQHGGFKSIAELQQLALLDAETYKKLEPYLEVK
jgi:DNA uptake protein ComE-like DNA-binding protein